jgi:hypothetical protein
MDLLAEVDEALIVCRIRLANMATADRIHFVQKQLDHFWATYNLCIPEERAWMHLMGELLEKASSEDLLSASIQKWRDVLSCVDEKLRLLFVQLRLHEFRDMETPTYDEFALDQILFEMTKDMPFSPAPWVQKWRAILSYLPEGQRIPYGREQIDKLKNHALISMDLTGLDVALREVDPEYRGPYA